MILLLITDHDYEPLWIKSVASNHTTKKNWARIQHTAA